MTDILTLDRRAMLGAIAAAAVAGAARARGREADDGAVQGVIDQYVAAKRVPGAVVAVLRPGGFRPRFHVAGQTAFTGGMPVTPDTLWRVYSMSKPITALAVMQQVALGALTLDTPIADIMPEFKTMRVLVDPAKSLESRPTDKPILLRHLLTHTAGFSYSIVGNGPLEREYHRLGLLPGSGSAGAQPGDGPIPDLTGFATGLASLPLYQEPGTAWRYSVGLDLCGALLERLTGKRFDAVLAAQVFGPLGMADTGFSVPPAKLSRLSTNYAWVNRELKPLDAPWPIDGPQKTDWLGPQKLLSGGGGLVASARDYARFAQMMLDEGVFEGRTIAPRGTIRAQMSNLLPEGVFYEGHDGFGAGGSVTLFDTAARAADGRPAGVYGWGGAAGTQFFVDPVNQVAVVAMLQYFPSSRFPFHTDLRVARNRDAGYRA